MAQGDRDLVPARPSTRWTWVESTVGSFGEFIYRIACWRDRRSTSMKDMFWGVYLFLLFVYFVISVVVLISKVFSSSKFRCLFFWICPAVFPVLVNKLVVVIYAIVILYNVVKVKGHYIWLILVWETVFDWTDIAQTFWARLRFCELYCIIVYVYNCDRRCLSYFVIFCSCR